MTAPKKLAPKKGKPKPKPVPAYKSAENAHVILSALMDEIEPMMEAVGVNLYIVHMGVKLRDGSNQVIFHSRGPVSSLLYALEKSRAKLMAD